MTTSLACWNCGTANPPGAKFCSNCGKPLLQHCPECGAEVADGAKFCANCGIRLRQESPVPLEGPALTAETRKVVTVLFADLAGSTSLTERLDPEEAREVVGKFYTVVQGVVEDWHEGTVANYLGDGVLAVFGLPAAHEDDPERAVRAGLAIQQAMPVLNTHLASSHGVQLGVRIGINTGEVVAQSGSTFQRDFLVSDAVTTAARLQQTVPTGTVVVGERTHRLTREAIDYRDLPPLPVKGKEAPLRAWAAVAALPERAEVRRVTAPLVGRHGELGILRSLYVRGRDAARVHLVTILGQPGVGKSRLLREFLAEVRPTDPAPLVLRGRGVAFGGQIGYHALLDILRFQAGLLDTDSSDVVRTKLAQWLEETLPGRNLLQGLLLTFGAEDGEPERIRRELFEAWQTLVTELAAARPVILAFEDAHWADEAVLDLIDMLVARATGVPLFIVCLARPELLERRPGWSGGRRNASSIDVEPLPPHEAEQLVGALGSQELPADAVKMIAQRAEGNPLFVEELVRMMMEGSAPGAQIPDTVQAVLTARIDRLQPNERRALQAGSVIGRTFWPSAASAIAGLSEEEIAQALDALVTKEFIVARPKSTIAGESEFAFRHILTRDVAYNLLPRTQRQRAHAQTARWIESRLLERQEEVIEILAEHLRVAGDERAPEYLYRAGAKARRQYANADALRLFTQALDAAGHGAPGTLAAAIHHERGDVYQLTGEYQRAMADYEAGLSSARAAGDRTLEARLQNKTGLIHHRQMHLEAAERSFQQAVQVAREAGDRLALGQSLVDLANIAWDRGQMPPEHPAIVEGLALLREVGDHAGLARGLNLLCISYIGAGDAREAIATAQEALEAARAAGDRSREATSLSYLCVIHGFFGKYDEALPYGVEALKVAEAIGDRRRIAYSQFFIGRVQTSYGQWAEARANLELGRSQPGLARIQYPWLYHFSGMVHDLVGESEQAKAMWRSGAAVETNSPAWRQISLLSAIALAGCERDTDGLRRALDEAVALPAGGFIPSDMEAALAIGEALLDAGRVEDFERFVEARRPGIERLGSQPGLAGLAILDARRAATAGDLGRAAGLLEAATAASGLDAVRLWRALELRVDLLNRPEDRSALREFLQKMAASLPDDLRRTFLSSPRVGASGGEGGI